MPRHSCCEVRVMQLHDIFLLRTSAILPEAISAGGLTPTTDTSLFLTTYRGGSHLPADIIFSTKSVKMLAKWWGFCKPPGGINYYLTHKNNLLNFTKYGILNKIYNKCSSNCLHQRIPHLYDSLTFAVPGVSKLYKIEVKHYEIQ